MAEATAAELSALFGLDVRSVYALAERGIVTRVGSGRYDRDRSTAAYLAHLREQAAGRRGEVLDLADERARLAQKQSEKLDLEIAQKRGTMVLLNEVMAVWERIGDEVRKVLLAIPSKVAPGIAAGMTPAEIEALVREHIDEALAALSTAEYVPDQDHATDGQLVVP